MCETGGVSRVFYKLRLRKSEEGKVQMRGEKMKSERASGCVWVCFHVCM